MGFHLISLVEKCCHFCIWHREVAKILRGCDNEVWSSATHNDERKAYGCRKMSFSQGLRKHYTGNTSCMNATRVNIAIFSVSALAWHPCCPLHFCNAHPLQTYLLLSGFQGRDILKDSQSSRLNGSDVYTQESVLANEMPVFSCPCCSALIKNQLSRKPCYNHASGVTKWESRGLLLHVECIVHIPAKDTGGSISRPVWYLCFCEDALARELCGVSSGVQFYDGYTQVVRCDRT